MSKQRDKGQSKQENRREKQDRRAMDNSADFPFKTKEGLIVMKDRRVRPDRRLNNIAVDTEEIDQEQFEETYQRYFDSK